MKTLEIWQAASQQLRTIRNSSAELCLSESADAIARCDEKSARMWALRSLQHSVGVFHPAYKAASA